MKHQEKAVGNWNQIKTAILNRWHELDENDLIQSSGIPELANLISTKVGEPRPNVLHELVNLVQTIDQGHPILKDYFDNTLASGDDGSKLRPTDENEPRLHS